VAGLADFKEAWRKETIMTQATDMSGGGAGAQDDEALVYQFLTPGARLHVLIGIGNGHTAEISAFVDQKKWGPSKDNLVIDEPTEPFFNKVLSFVADVTAGPGPQRPALLTVTLYQFDAAKPAEHAVQKTFNVQRAFGASNVLRVDFGIALK
jgi:hypothetical protein